MKHFYTFIVCTFLSLTMIAQGKMDDKAKPKDDKGGKFDRSLDYDYKVEKKAQVTVKGKAIPYQVTAATLPVWGSGKTIAFSIPIMREQTSQIVSRPIVFSFNGGPGTASVWMMLGYTSAPTTHR
jgi:carboxypeptidase C (cathepsin A)